MRHNQGNYDIGEIFNFLRGKQTYLHWSRGESSPVNFMRPSYDPSAARLFWGSSWSLRSLVDYSGHVPIVSWPESSTEHEGTNSQALSLLGNPNRDWFKLDGWLYHGLGYCALIVKKLGKSSSGEKKSSRMHTVKCLGHRNVH